MQLQFRTEHVDIIGTQQAKQERPHVPKFQGNQQCSLLVAVVRGTRAVVS
jgi:hypothetical protein